MTLTPPPSTRATRAARLSSTETRSGSQTGPISAVLSYAASNPGHTIGGAPRPSSFSSIDAVDAVVRRLSWRYLSLLFARLVPVSLVSRQSNDPFLSFSLSVTSLWGASVLLSRAPGHEPDPREASLPHLYELPRSTSLSPFSVSFFCFSISNSTHSSGLLEYRTVWNRMIVAVASNIIVTLCHSVL